MISPLFFLAATLLLSLNLVRPYGLAISDWLYFGALSFAFLETLSMDRCNVPCWWRNRFLVVVAVIMFGAIVSTMNSTNWMTALMEVFQHLFVMTVFISLIWIMVRRGKATQMIFAFILTGLFTAAVVLVDYSTGSRYGLTLSGTPNVEWWGRFAGTLGHPNKLGYFLVLTVLLSIGQLLTVQQNREPLLLRGGWVAVITVQVFGIYLSGSMTAYIGLLLGGFILFLSAMPLWIRSGKSFGIAAGVGICIFLLVMVLNNQFIHRIINVDNNPVTQAYTRVQTTTANARIVIYEDAFVQIARNPWFGVGYDQIATSGLNPASGLPVLDVHNSLLQIWYTGGFFAFLGWLFLYIWLGWMAVGTLFRVNRSPHAYLLISVSAAILAILLMDQFLDSIYQREKWLVIGLMAGLYWEKAGSAFPLRSSRSEA